MKSSRFQVPSSKRSSKVQTSRDLSDWGAPRVGVMELHEGTQSAAGGKPFDLEERTALFGEGVVRFAKKIPRGPGNDRLIDQLVGAALSVGANYCEASETVSRKDFRYAISLCVKEAKETRFLLRMTAAASPQLTEEAGGLYRRARELHLIFASMFRKR